VKWVHCYYNEGDDITEVAKAAEEVFLSPVDPNWGAMGHGGYLGIDGRVKNFDCAHTPNMPVVNGHSAIFEPANLPAWGAFIGHSITLAGS